MLLQAFHSLVCLWMLLLMLYRKPVLLLHSLSISKWGICSTVEALPAGQLCVSWLGYEVMFNGVVA